MRATCRLPKLLRALSTRPAEILGLPGGRLAPGAPADLILFDPDAPYVLDKRELHSRSKNTPFDEARLQGPGAQPDRLARARPDLSSDRPTGGRSADDSWIPAAAALRPGCMPHSMNWSLDAPYFLAALVVRLSPRLDPVRPALHPPRRARRHAQDRLRQYRRDQRPAHRPQGPCRGDASRRRAQGHRSPC